METVYICSNCKFWNKIGNSEYSMDMGDCTFLSGKRDSDEYPDVEKTGIESTPICAHDGIGFEYQTKSWFGCTHFSDK